MEVKLSNEASRQILAALERDDVVAAIKIYREQTNCGLAEAKRAVEQLHKVSDMLGAIGSPFRDGASANISTSVSTSELTVNNVRVPDDIAAKIQAALQSGDESAVIDMLRSTCNLDAAGAKNILDRMKQLHSLTRQDDTGQPEDESDDDDESYDDDEDEEEEDGVDTASEILNKIHSTLEENPLGAYTEMEITVNGVEVPDDMIEKMRVALRSGNESEVLKNLHDFCNLDLNGATNSVNWFVAYPLQGYQTWVKGEKKRLKAAQKQIKANQLKARNAAAQQPRFRATPSSQQVVGAGDSPHSNALLLLALILLVAVAAWWFFSS